MSEIKITECRCCGNRDNNRFVKTPEGYICKCCGVGFRYETEEEKINCMMGYRQLKNYRFAEARETFIDVLYDYPESIDARWGLLLARWGIVFVKGFFDDIIEPVYCFPEYDELDGKTFQGETEYKEIMKLVESDTKTRYFYESKGKEIDRAIKKFSECKKSTERDVFICVKISAATEKKPGAKGRTADYEYAMSVYKDLKKRGVNAFFSFVTLENDVNSDDLIWVNLVKSKKLLLIGSERDYLESAWVKSEWKRWLFLERENDMHICVLKHDHENPKSVLPRELYEKGPQIYTLDTYDKMIENLCAGLSEQANSVSAASGNSSSSDDIHQDTAPAKDEAQELCDMGEKYYEGKDGVAQSYRKALDYFKKSAALGNANAQCYMGIYYDKGLVVNQDYKEALTWFKKSAEQDYLDSKLWLGVCYYKGKGVAQDYKEAVKWFMEAAEQGSGWAQNQLAVCYRDGDGVKQDYAKAVEWYTKAAEQGVAEAQNSLAMRYAMGQGVAQNYKKAAEWYRKAAEQGNAAAQYNLADAYEKGQGVMKSYKKAIEWYTKSADQGESVAQEALNRLKKKKFILW